MALENFIILNNKVLNKDLDVVHNKHLSIYWIVNQMCLCLRMLRTPNTPDTFTKECNFTEMFKSGIITRQFGVRKVCSWHTL